MRLSTLIPALALGLFSVSGLSAQNFPFQLFVEDQNQNITPVGNGSTLTLGASVPGQAVTITLIAIYQGATNATLSQPQLLGSTSFVATKLQPTSLTPGQSASLQLTFTPPSSIQATAEITIPYIEAAGGPAAPASSGLITATLVGTAPLFTVSYSLSTNQNVVPLADGGTVTFPSTSLQSSSTATIQIVNSGSGAGLIQSVQVTGASFSAQSLPLFPGTLAAKATLQFPVQFTPQQNGTNTGTLQIVFPDHTVNVTLTGTGAAPAYTYQLSVNGQTSTIHPNDTLTLPSADPGTAVPFSITVQNTGNGPGTINALVVGGAGFQAINAPIFPQTINPGQSLPLSFTFSPLQAGTFNGSVRIGNDNFTLKGATTGAQLGYTYTSGSASPAIISNGGTLFFSPVQVGQSSNATFTIQNTGTTATTVASIYIPTAKSAFSLTGLPNGPVTVAPNAAVSFNIVFSPTVTGANTAVLQIDNQTFNLSGPGNAPPPLPSYQFQGSASGVVSPLQQPSIGLTLSAPYPVALTGTLTIVQTPLGFNQDPSVQFSTGGVTVAFSIPANQTLAIFQNNSTTVKIQTGSIAGQITIVPAFSTTGGINVTPNNPAALQFSVLGSAPQLVSVQVSQSSAAGFTLQVVGLSPSRTLSTLDFVFTAAPSFNLAATKVSLNIAGPAATWFQSAASVGFGGQFTITVPFALSSTTSVATPVTAIQSVSVTASNDQGTSNTVTAQIQ